jgi:hypothetical protein
MMSALVSIRPRRILRFFGPRGDLLAAEAPRITVYDPTGDVLFRTELDDFLDVAPVGNELWVIAPDRLTRLSARDGRVLGAESLAYVDTDGRFLQSSIAPQLPIWHCAHPVVVRASPARLDVPGPGGEVILPITDNRWLLWQSGQLRLWRSAIGDAWRTQVGDPGSRAIDAQLILEGRLYVLVQQRTAHGSDADGRELRLTVAQVSDGEQNTQLRVPAVSQLVIAARRGLALARSGDRLNMIDLRFGRWIRELIVPDGALEIAVDDGLQRIALASAGGLELMRIEALAVPAMLASASNPGIAVPPSELELDDAPPNGAVEIVDVADPLPSDPVAEAVEALPDAPLLRLDPVTATSTATVAQIAHSVELRLQLVGALAAAAIAEAWDNGRIAKPDPTRPPFADEVGGLLKIVSGRQPDELVSAVARLRSIEELVVTADGDRAPHLTPLDVLAIDCELSPTAVAILFSVVAPRLRGELARLYGILANDPDRPLVDEHLLGQLLGPLLGAESPQIAHELDGDRPLRRYGLIHVGAGDRPFAALAVDPLVVRYVANFGLDGEPDPHLTVRSADCELDDLQMPRTVISRALHHLAAPPARDPARIVVRGRTGCGRHTLLAALAARAGRALGVIDLTTMPRDPLRLPAMLEIMLRRAKLRGLVPCIDGLELGIDDPDSKTQLGVVLREHPGPVALRLPPDARVPLDPGYLLLDIPPRNEQLRSESWAVALDRNYIELPDPSELAARYRVGPGIIERVCAEVARRPERPSGPDAPAAWMRELDDAVRQHLENRLGTTARRVTRLASWADIVLPEDITDSLLELTARVRHRKTVYEKWGFDRSMTTSRGITALFQGSPGTGKTMVAGVIARDLGLELYRVDVSRITSKWIGETEKNLGSLFDAAEDGQVMLLFDEADSLFAKRTEVRTSVDRYANMEVNYLLQRLDSFEGIAILTTNFGSAIDPAFKRRLTYRVTFPFPDEEMREQLWRSLIPPQVPVQGAIDFAGLSQRFRLSGGYIRNAALRAAFLAAEEGSSLTHAHLERAIRMEFREIGKLAESGTLE